MYLTSLHQFLVGDVGLVVRSSVDGDALDIALLIAQLGRREAQRATVGQGDSTLTEEWRDQFVASTQGIDGVEAQGSEDVQADI